MRIGVMSDVHGNRVALDAVLADVESHPVDQWVCLGDTIQGGPQPAEVVERLRALHCPVIIGNADAEVLDPNATEGGLRDVSVWTAEQLGESGLDFLRSFVPTYELSLGAAGTLLCFHGTPRSFDEVLLPETPPAELRDGLSGDHAAVMCGGHTHLQWTTTVDGGRRFFNQGSVGLAYNRHTPREKFHLPAIRRVRGPDGAGRRRPARVLPGVVRSRRAAGGDSRERPPVRRADGGPVLPAHGLGVLPVNVLDS
jgi:predicted phosphodiesterase